MKEESSMEQTFLTKVDIKKVRHLHDISIPLSNESRKHLLLTGKNGSGKTSVLEALVRHLQFIVSNQYQPEKEIKHSYDLWTIKNEKNKHIMETEQNLIEIQKPKSNMSLYFNLLKQWCEVNKLSETMNVLYKTLKQYKDNPDEERYQRSLRGMLSRGSKFAAFKSYYVREHLEDYPELKEYVS